MDKLLRVFVVEDSPSVLDSLLVFLHIPGQVEIVGLADTEEEAIAAILAGSPDAIIVDLNLREGNGLAVIDKVRQAGLTSMPRIIVFTNHASPEIKQRALQLGADHVFDKSVEQEGLRNTLQSMRAGQPVDEAV